MGLIKTAMTSGAAIYGIKQFANIAQQRQQHQSYQPPRPQPQSRGRMYNDSDAYYYDDEDMEYPPPRRQAHRPLNFQELNRQSRSAEGIDRGFQQQPRGQRLALEEESYNEEEYPIPGHGLHQQQQQQQSPWQRHQPVHSEDYDYNSDYAHPPPVQRRVRPLSYQQQQGFVEDHEVSDDQSEMPRSWNGAGGCADMVNQLAMQAMNMGLIGGGKKEKDKGKGGKGELLMGLIGK